MHNSNLVDVLDTCDYLLEEATSLAFLNAGVSHNVIEQLAAISILHYKEEFFRCLNDLGITESYYLVELDDIRVPQHLKDLDLFGDSFHVCLLLDLVLLEDLDGYLQDGGH
jgi:hypothetical protein